MFVRTGKLAREWCGLKLPLKVCRSGAGYYIGTWDESGPISRESEEYWGSKEKAQEALDKNEWTQREHP